MSSSEVLHASGPLVRPGRYARAAEPVAPTREPALACRPDAVNPRLSSWIAGHRAAPLIRDPRVGAERRTIPNLPGLADGCTDP